MALVDDGYEKRFRCVTKNNEGGRRVSIFYFNLKVNFNPENFLPRDIV